MVRATHHRQLNTAGLEADVMRFMAIIAFCLIAMMALVKDVEPQIEKKSDSITQKQPEVTVKAEASPAGEAKPDPEPNVQQNPAKQITATKVLAQKEPVSAVPYMKPPVSTSTTRKTPLAIEPVPESVPHDAIAKTNPTSITVEEQVAEERTPQNSEPEPLTFRFESDKTFLHLISTDRLQLYAHTDKGFLAMDDRFNIIESRPSGELFEVTAQSIPAKIKSIFDRVNTSPVYLVALPVETRRDLNNFLGARGENSTSGVLIIHRNGRISHEI